MLAGKLSQISGVAKVSISGAAKPGIRIQVNPRALADMHMSTAAVKSAVLRASASLPKGEISDGGHAIALAANDQLMTAADYKNVIVEWKNGAAVKLPDIANVFDSTINDDRAGWFDDDSAVVLYVLKDADANVVQTVDTTLKMLPQLERWMPAGIKVHVLYDRTLLIRAAVSDVQFTMTIAILLVVLVVFLFLRRFWTTVIPTVTIPVSLAVTMAMMYALGFSLDNISLMAVTIAMGFVIDEAGDHHRKHRAARLRGRRPDRRRPEGNAADGIHGGLDHRRADRRADPNSVHARHRRPAVSRIRADPGRSDHRFGDRLPDADADDVRPSAQPPGHAAEPAFRHRQRGIVDWRASACTPAAWPGRFERRWLALTVAAALAAASVGVVTTLPKGFLPTQDTGMMRGSHGQPVEHFL